MQSKGMERDHPIAKYLEKTGETQAEFARRVGISGPYLSQILRWERGVKLVTAQKFERATMGSVKMADLIRQEPA